MGRPHVYCAGGPGFRAGLSVTFLEAQKLKSGPKPTENGEVFFTLM